MLAMAKFLLQELPRLKIAKLKSNIAKNAANKIFIRRIFCILNFVHFKKFNIFIIMTENEFNVKYNIDPEELSYLGAGDFGTAYEIDDTRVLKKTSSKSEFNIAKEIVNKTEGGIKNIPALEGFVKFYVAEIVNGEMWIIMEKLDEDSDIENNYYALSELLESQGLPIQYVDNLDPDDLEDYQKEQYNELESFIRDIQDINHSYRYIGIEASDVRPENLGTDANGKIKAFDIEDRAMNELRKHIRKIIKENIDEQVRLSTDDHGKIVLIQNGNSVILYDTSKYDENDIFNGIIGYSRVNFDRHQVEIRDIAADKSYGSLLYELIMKVAYPLPVVSSRDGDTNHLAEKVYNKFINGENPNIKTKTLTPFDNGYIDEIFGTNEKESPGFIKMVNTLFYAKENAGIDKMLSDGNQFIKENNIDIHKLTSDGHAFFIDNLHEVKNVIKKIIAEEIHKKDDFVFDEDFYDYQGGQNEVKMNMYHNDRNVAYASYSIFENKVQIKMIETLYPGNNYGFELMKQIAKIHGYENIERSYFTGAGAKLRKKLDDYFNFDYEAHKVAQSKQIPLEKINDVKNVTVKTFLMDLIKNGYTIAWKNLLATEEFKTLSDNIDFNDIADLSEWVSGSETNQNEITEEPPVEIFEILKNIL